MSISPRVQTANHKTRMHPDRLGTHPPLCIIFPPSGKHVVPQDTYPPPVRVALQHILHVP